MKKLAILATHPIQYQIPWFRALSDRPAFSVKVYFSMLPDQQQQGTGFGVPFEWDIPLFKGYMWQALENKARVPGLGRFFGTNTPGIYAELARSRPDAVIITGWQSWSLLQGLWACIRLGIPTIIRAESNALRERAWWIRVAHRTLLSRFNAFLAIGAANQVFYLDNSVDSSLIFPCRYFVDNARIRAQYDACVGSREELRAAWDIPSEKVCFLFAGKLQQKKRILDLLNALRLVCDAEPQLHIHLLVVGTGDLMEQSMHLAEAAKLPVSFAGFLNQSEMPKAYAAADCLVLPSDFGETWGLVVNEAMVCGLPAIVSDRVGCGPDLVPDGVTGAIFPFGNVGELARRLVEMATDHEGRKAMGEQAQKHVNEYTVEKAVEGTIEAFNFVTAKPAG